MGLAYPSRTFDDPARAGFLYAEHERLLTVAEEQERVRDAARYEGEPPRGVRVLQGFFDDERTYAVDGDSVEAYREGLRRGKEVAAALEVVTAGWGDRTALEWVQAQPEHAVPTYLRARVREIRSGDSQRDRERAAAALRFETASRWAFGAVIGVGLASLIGSLLLRRAESGWAHQREPLRITLLQAVFVYVWCETALSVCWRLSWAGVGLVSELTRLVPSVVSAVVVLGLAYGMRWQGTNTPFRQLFGLPKLGRDRIQLALAAVAPFGVDTAASYAAQAGGERLGLDPRVHEHFVEALMYGADWERWLAGVNLVLLAPLGEELLFRGVLFGGLLTRMSALRAALLSSLIFAIVHGYGLIGTVEIALAGCVLAWTYRVTGSLLPGIAAHAAMNAWVVFESLRYRI